SGDIAVALGVRPGGAPVTFQGKGYEVRVSWPPTGWLGGNLGSTRAVAQFACASIGDRLRLDFDVSNQTVQATAITEEALTQATPFEALKLLTGVRAADPTTAIIELDDSLGNPFAGAVATLRVRGDEDVARAVEAI